MAVYKIILVQIGCLLAAVTLQAQDYTVSSKAHRINDTKYEGFAILITGKTETITTFVYDYVKERSKLRRKRNFYSISQFAMNSTSLDSTVVFMKMIEKQTGVQVWMAAKEAGQHKERLDEINQSIKKELVLLARSYYVHRQELKIHEAEKAAATISKQQQNLIESHAALTKKLEAAQTRKSELEALLEENDLAIKTLQQQLIDNKQAQDSVYLDLQKVNRVIETQKQELKEID